MSGGAALASASRSAARSASVGAAVAATSLAAVPSSSAVSAAASASGPPRLAARKTDATGGHGKTVLGAFIGGLIGAVVGAVIVAGAIAAVVATGGAALLVAATVAGALLGAVSVTAGGVAAGARVGKTFPGSPCGKGKTGSGETGAGSPVFIESQPAARLEFDKGDHGGKAKVKSGCAVVYVNGKPLARIDDKLDCGGKFVASSQRTYVSPATVTSASEAGDSIEDVATKIATVAGLAGAALAMGPLIAGIGLVGAVATVGAGFVLGAAGESGGAWVGRKIDAANNTEGRWENILGPVGGFAGGMLNPIKVGPALGRAGTLGEKNLPRLGGQSDIIAPGDPGYHAQQFVDIVPDPQLGVSRPALVGPKPSRPGSAAPEGGADGHFSNASVQKASVESPTVKGQLDEQRARAGANEAPEGPKAHGGGLAGSVGSNGRATPVAHAGGASSGCPSCSASGGAKALPAPAPQPRLPAPAPAKLPAPAAPAQPKPPPAPKVEELKYLGDGAFSKGYRKGDDVYKRVKPEIEGQKNSTISLTEDQRLAVARSTVEENNRLHALHPDLIPEMHLHEDGWIRQSFASGRDIGGWADTRFTDAQYDQASNAFQAAVKVLPKVPDTTEFAKTELGQQGWGLEFDRSASNWRIDDDYHVTNFDPLKLVPPKELQDRAIYPGQVKPPPNEPPPIQAVKTEAAPNAPPKPPAYEHEHEHGPATSAQQPLSATEHAASNEPKVTPHEDGPAPSPTPAPTPASGGCSTCAGAAPPSASGAANIAEKTGLKKSWQFWKPKPAVAPDPNKVYSLKQVPKEFKSDGSQPLYRGSRSKPDALRARGGFSRKSTSTQVSRLSLEEHVNPGGTINARDQWVSTSTGIEAPMHTVYSGMNGYVYEIRQAGGVDVNKLYGSEVHGIEREVTLESVPWKKIKGWYPVSGGFGDEPRVLGEFVPNPDFKP